MSLSSIFAELIQKYTTDTQLSEDLWNEIERNYTHKKRHYHTLQHLENVLLQLTNVRNEIDDWDTILFSIFYHDVIYDASKKNNEEKSAELAEKRLLSLSYPGNKISKCVSQILATKGHSINPDADTNLFTDADLSILGQDWAAYSEYFTQIRKEYSLYPDLIYNLGRKNVLDHFLKMDRIFKTTYFHDGFESQARKNIQDEIQLLER